MGGRTERCRTPWLGRPQGEGIPSLVRLQAPSLTLGVSGVVKAPPPIMATCKRHS